MRIKIIIISGGTPPSFEILTKELNDSKFIICADSGANCLINYNITPDFIIGDLDSIDKEILKKFKKNGVKIETYKKDKDDTDTFLAMQKAIKLGANEIVFLGCI